LPPPTVIIGLEEFVDMVWISDRGGLTEGDACPSFIDCIPR
jgi:hypothetical protein